MCGSSNTGSYARWMEFGTWMCKSFKNPDICGCLIISGENRGTHKEVVASSVMHYTACSLLNLKITKRKMFGLMANTPSQYLTKQLAQGAAYRDCILLFLLSVAVTECEMVLLCG